MGGRDGDLGYPKALWKSGKFCSTYYIYTTDASSPTRVFVFFSLSGHQAMVVSGNRDYTGMWVRLGSTDLMAGKVMFLRSNQGGRFDGNESVADSFRSDLVNFKSSCTTILGAFYSFFVCQKKPPLSGSSPATRGQSHPSLSPSFKAK
ncbi:hypothetical protein TNCV_26431 [Trichonephila clavipes]|uniref:Uncharacterized protein n=1 Tax=Trichonephila clavipes TaxID=2585209 RepID=A0A8X6WKJ8_TRICX|nr:hypothetical protein TNCV_26431 [Trichonephila clavipes]